MAIAVEQVAGETYGSNVTFSSPTTTGNCIVVGCGTYDGGGTSGAEISDNKGNTYTEAVVVVNGQGSSHIWYCLNATGGSGHQVTATPESGSPDLQLSAVELSGVGAYEDSNSGSGIDGGTATPGSLTSDDGDFLYARLEEEEEAPSGATWAGATSLGIADYSQSLYKLVSSGGSEEPSWSLTSGDDWEATIARFSPGGGTYSLSGTTKNNSGAALGSCDVFLLKDNGDNTMSFIAHTTSNATTGAYSFTGLTDGAGLCVIAWKDDTPHVMDATDWVLTGTEE